MDFLPTVLDGALALLVSTEYIVNALRTRVYPHDTLYSPIKTQQVVVRKIAESMTLEHEENLRFKTAKTSQEIEPYPACSLVLACCPKRERKKKYVVTPFTQAAFSRSPADWKTRFNNSVCLFSTTAENLSYSRLTQSVRSPHMTVLEPVCVFAPSTMIPHVGNARLGIRPVIRA